MYLGSVPLLTRGPFALMYGGARILPHLSPLPPDPGLPLLILLSTLFQLTLFAVKKARSEAGNYLAQLRASLVESVVNVYGVIIIIAISLGSTAYIIHHQV